MSYRAGRTVSPRTRSSARTTLSSRWSPSGLRLPRGSRAEGHLLPHLRGALRHGRDGRGRPDHQAAARPRPSALAGLRVSQGHRDARRPERSRPGRPSAEARGAGRRVRARLWDEAIDDIGDAAAGDHRRATARSPSAGTWATRARSLLAHAVGKGFLDALGSPHYYTAGSQDVNNRFAASALLYGTPLVVPIPDLQRTDFLLMVGANPLVSHGSVLTAPRVREQLHEIVSRGGRVVAVDPRRTETARQFEHVPVTPGHRRVAAALDAARDLRGRPRRRALPRGAHRGRRRARRHGAAVRARGRRPRAPASRPTRSASSRATSPRRGAAAYGRTGSCLGRFGTLVAFLLDALNAVTGNLDRPGGAVFGRPAVALDDVGEKAGLATYGKVRSRFGGFPDVIGNLPASLLPREITTPGERQIRALFVSAGNPVLSVPDGDALEGALGDLELMVSLDFYVNETNRHADYVLPTTDLLRARRHAARVPRLLHDAVHPVHRRGRADPPARRARSGRSSTRSRSGSASCRSRSRRCAMLGRLPGLRPKPRRIAELLLRTGPEGDLFGLRRGGLSLDKVARQPHGIVLADHIPTGVLSEKVRHKGSRVQLAPDGDRGRGRAPRVRERRRPGLPAAADRPARAALAQLLDAQRAAADARRPGARAARAPATTRRSTDWWTAAKRGSPRSRARSSCRSRSPTR